MPLSSLFERVERRGCRAADALVKRLAGTSSVFLATELPLSLLLLRRSERMRLAELRAHILRRRIGRFERAFRQLGRRINSIFGAGR